MEITFEIQNLKCGGCTSTIVNRLSKIEGIKNIIVNNENKTVSFISKKEDKVTDAIILLHKIGYPIIGERNALATKAKSFVSCAMGRINS